MIFLQRCRGKKNILFIFCIFTFILIRVEGEENREAICIRTEGYAEGPSYLARQMALAEAQKNAIKQYLFSIVSEEYLKYLNPLLNKAFLYLNSYKILNENTVNGKSTIELDVELNDELINKDVTTLLLPYVVDLPRISIYIIDLCNLPDNKYTEAVDSYNVIEKKMTNLKFITCKANIEKNFEKKEIIQLIDGGLEGRKRMALNQDADIFVFGINQYEILEGLYNNQMKKIRCNLTVELFRVQDGKLLDAFNITASVQSENLTEAQKQSAEDCALKSIQKIITSSFLSNLSYKKNTKDVSLYFESFDDKNLIKKVMDYLETITYGSKIELIFDTTKRTKYVVMYDGPIVYLVDSINNNIKLKDKIIIKKVINRDIYLLPSNEN